jgi:hypothetical protein
MSNAFKLVGFNGLSSVFHFVDFIVLLLSAKGRLHILRLPEPCGCTNIIAGGLCPFLNHWCSSSTSFPMVILMFALGWRSLDRSRRRSEENQSEYFF